MNDSTDFPPSEQPPAEHAWADPSSPPPLRPPVAKGGDRGGLQPDGGVAPEFPPAGAGPLGAASPAGAGPLGAASPGFAAGGSLPPGDHHYYGPPQWGPQRPAGRIRRRGARPAAVAALAVVALGGSALVTHAVWPSPSEIAAPSASIGTGGSVSPPTGVFPGYSFGSGGSTGGTSAGTPSSSQQGVGAPSDVSSIASKVEPGLVIVNSTFQYQEAQGAGTGIALTSNGEILTNNHVIDGATSIKVTDIGNGRTYTANVVGYNDTKDIAILQLVGASGLKTASIATHAAAVGDPVVAIGNAGGTGSLTPAGGSVTGLDKSITASDELDGASEALTGLIETNADVQSGDSGGPLVNAAGQVIGVDTAASQGYSLQSQYDGGSEGYAIPISEALSLARAIESDQPSSTTHVGPTAFLGVLVSSGGIDNHSFQSYSGQAASPSGAEVAGVVQGGSAATAGLAQGDTITSLDGQSVASAGDLTRIVSGLAPGQTVQLSYTDPTGSSHTVAVTLQSGPPA